MAVLTSGGRHALPDSAFAYIEPGHDGEKVDGKTPDKYRHFPVHDAAHVRNALARIGQGTRFAAQARAKVMAAAKKFGVSVDGSDTGRSFDSLYPEVRFLADVPEVRSIGDGQPPHITGYAAAFGKLSRRLGGFVERVMPTAFDEARSNGYPDVVCRYNHKDDMVLGTTAAGTLSLDIDERGLRYDVIPPNHRGDVMELVQRGDVRYSSFAFRCVNPGEDDEWGATDYGFPMRSLHRVSLLDVAPVLDPAYRDTSAVARNMAGAVESLASWVDADPAEVRSMLEAGQASRFFKRTDRPAVPKPEPVAEERVMLDDPAVALRYWRYADEPAQDPQPEDAERAMNTHDKMCRKYVHGEPCVLGDGHDGPHTPRCHGGQFEHGLPCAMPDGHGGPHQPMAVDDGTPQRGPGRPRNRDGEDTETAQEAETRDADPQPEPAQPKTMTGPEAVAAVLAMRAKLTSVD
jgi:HK97 family phage prohead protease